MYNLVSYPQSGIHRAHRGLRLEALASGNPAAKTVHKWKNGWLYGAAVDTFPYPEFILSLKHQFAIFP